MQTILKTLGAELLVVAGGELSPVPDTLSWEGKKPNLMPL